MNWTDERYVRVYTRDTGDWLSLSFEAQGVWMLMLRKFDRAGHIYVGKGGRRMLAAVLGHPARQEVVDRALDEILAVEFAVLSEDGQRVTSPNFRAAQDWVKTDAERAKDYRDRKRGPKPAESEEAVTERHAPSRASRKRHPSRAVPPPPSVPPVPSVPSSSAEPEEDSKPPPTANGAAVVAVYSAEEHWPPDTPERFLAWIAWDRRNAGLEAEPTPRGFRDWFVKAVKQHGPEALARAYAEYRSDKHFAERGWPTAIFITDGVFSVRVRRTA